MPSIIITLTFDSSPIKGEGNDASASLYGFPLPRGMTVNGWGAMHQHRHSGLDPESTGWGCPDVTLTFDSSPIKGEGTMLAHRCMDSRFRGE